jgi:response regulator of citrate/malate metabolism
MGSTELTVLVVDDDFRVANMHAGIVNALPNFTVAATANTLAGARKADAVDLALVDVYLPDGSGIDFVRELRCDSMVLSAATEADTIRAAVAAGALSYLVKPFAPTELAARLSGYARYRRILSGPNLAAKDVDAALDALRPRVASQQSSTAAPSPTKELVLQALRASGQPMSSAEMSAAIGVSRATAQRYLATLATTGDVKIGLRYGTTGRPEQEFMAIARRSDAAAR